LQEGALGDCSHENMWESFFIVLIRIGGHKDEAFLWWAAVWIFVVRNGSIEHIFNPFEAIPQDYRIELIYENSSVFHEQRQFKDVMDRLINFGVLHDLADPVCSLLWEPVVGVPGVDCPYFIAKLLCSWVEVVEVDQLAHCLSVELILSVDPKGFGKAVGWSLLLDFEDSGCWGRDGVLCDMGEDFVGAVDPVDLYEEAVE
jgi:hypothetical protein